MKKIIIVVCFLGLQLVVFGQEKFIALKLAPLSVIDPNYSSLVMGLEVKPFQNWGAVVEYGIKTPSLIGSEDLKSENIQLFKFRSELRLYTKNFEGLYFGVEYFTSQKKYTSYNSYYLHNQDLYDYESSNVDVKVYGYCLKSGSNIHLTKRLFLDVFFGLGQRWVNVNHQSENEELLGKFPKENVLLFDRIDEHEGITKKYHLAAGFKVGYRIINL